MPGGILYLSDQGFSITGKATATISGGQIVKVISGANVLTTTSNLGQNINFALLAGNDAQLAVGVAIETVVSGQQLGVATTGVHGFFASASISAGSSVMADPAVTSSDAVIQPAIDSTSGFALKFGRALTAAASGQLVAVHLGR